MSRDPEKDWKEFWKKIVCDSDGNIDVEQLKKELSDFRFLMDQASRVYEHVTAGGCSRIDYSADTIIQVHDANKIEEFEEWLKEELESRRLQMHKGPIPEDWCGRFLCTAYVKNVPTDYVYFAWISKFGGVTLFSRHVSDYDKTIIDKDAVINWIPIEDILEEVEGWK